MQRWVFERRRDLLSFYNVSWEEARPQRNVGALSAADWIFLFSSNEFTYHGGEYTNPLFTKGMNEKIALARPAFEGKRVVLFTMDARDTEELLRRDALRDVKLAEFHTIDEADFPATVQSVRFNQIGTHPVLADERHIPFAYWGTTKRTLPGGEKSGDFRYEAVRALAKEMPNVWIAGNHFGSLKADHKFNTNLRVLEPILRSARATCCFQWPGFNHRMTARYPEALAFGMVPFVWGSYGVGGAADEWMIADWQRVWSIPELVDQVALTYADDHIYHERLNQCLYRWKRDAPVDDSQFVLLSKKLKEIGL